AIHKELGDSLVRAVTTASSLEAEQDSGGGPSCQETMGDTIIQTRVESFRDGEDASKQGKRIDSINADDEIILINDADNKMFNVEDLGGDETASQEQEELFDAEKATLFQNLLVKRRKHFAAKSAEEKRNKPQTQAQKRKIMCTYLKNMEGYKLKDLKLKEFDKIQEMFDRAFKRVNTFEDIITELVKGKENRVGEELIQESTKKQKVEDDKENIELKQLMVTIPNEEEIAIDAIPLAVKSPRMVN
nr:hypothetical protein [Tanacetum cinerariifolium]